MPIVNDKFTRKFSRLTRHSEVGEKYVNSLTKAQLKDSPFIYPLFIGSNKIFLDRIPTPPTSVIEDVKNKKGKIIFFYLNEGDVHTPNQISLLEDFSIECGFTKDDVTFFHGNMLLENVKSTFITFKHFNLFEASIWQFSNVIRSVPRSVETHIDNFNSKKSIEKKYYFNCFNRVPRDPRVFLVSLLKSNPLVSSKSLISIGSQKFKNETYNKKEIPFNREVIKKEEDLNNVNQFINTEFDKVKENGLVVDYKDMNRINTHKVNLDVYKNCFIDIIAETVTNPNCIFFTEKTFRSISIKQPFFLLGGKHSLKYLKTLGYKTFDKWWDESYDSYDNIYDRTYQAYITIKQISLLDKKSLYLMISEMQEVLDYNFNHFFYGDRHKKALW